MRTPKQRLVELDALRGLAALCVLLHHGWLSQPIHPAPLRWLFEHTPFGVAIDGRQPVLFFFVLSGFVLTRALLSGPPPGWANYAAQRTVRLGLPSAAALTASLLMLAATRNGSLPPWQGGSFMVGTVWTDWPSVADLLRQALLLGHAGQISLDPVLWSLVHEWRVSLLLPGVLLFRGRPAWLLCVGVAGSVAAVALGAPGNVTVLGNSLAATFLATLYFLLPFAVGGALALAGERSRITGPARWLAGLAVPVLACSDADLAAVTGSALLILLALEPGPILAWLRHPVPVWLGKVSFSLYLIHLPLLACVVHLLHGALPITVIVAMGMLLSFPAAALLHWAAEAPAHRLARLVAKLPAERSRQACPALR